MTFNWFTFSSRTVETAAVVPGLAEDVKPWPATL